ncbi:MAG: CinA family protein [Clostridia bacterium]|nr:CinA family protein [Clostridia bacterium]
MKLNEEVVALLAQKGLKIATAESCTGGLLAKLITDVSGASEVFDYGIVSYANAIKWGQLGVQRQTVETFGAVSEQTASEMAQCAAKNAQADIGLATTGIAGPTGGTPEKPNGTCYIGLYYREKTKVYRINTGLSERAKNRQAFAEKALQLVKEELNG